MNQAFQITIEDVMCVVENHGKVITEEKAQALFNELDLDSVEDAALSELEMEDQIDAAYKEIGVQLQNEIAMLT